MTSLRLIQFTDPHLFANPAETLRGVASLPALAQTLAHAQTHDWPADAVLVTGDLVQDDPGGYRHFRRLFGELGVPVLCLPGNHDEPAAMHRELTGEPFVTRGCVDLGAWRVVLLDSTVPGAAHGHLSERSLAELDEALRSAGTRHVMVCLHHQPVPMASQWLDRVGLANPDDFWRVVERHRNARAVVWGHVHQRFDGLHKGVRLLATPATCAQFLPRSDDFAVDTRPPAYRTLELRPDGTLVSEVVWIDACAPGLSQSYSAA